MSLSLRRGFAWVLVLFCCIGWAAPVRAQRAQPSVAILVVSDGTDPRMKELEAQATAFVKRLRQEQGLDKALLPILSYHFNVPAERKYCEEKLDIHKNDLLFVGVVQQQNMVVKKILKRSPRVQDPKSEAFQMFKRVALILGYDPGALSMPGTVPTPTPSETPVAGTGDSQLAFNRIVVTNDDGIPTNDFSTTDRGVFFTVFVKNLAPQTPHQHDLRVTVHGPDPKLVAPPLGGHFTADGPNINGRDVLRIADPSSQGFAIADNLLAEHPGQYKVDVELDGRQVGEETFNIKGVDIKGVSQLSIAKAFLGDDKGNPKTEFKTTDVGVFAFVILENDDMNEDHEHLLSVSCYDPDGQKYGPDLGGKFVVKKGEDLSSKEFPADADVQGVNGFLIKDGKMSTRPGNYKIVLKIDGVTVKEMPFTLSQ